MAGLQTKRADTDILWRSMLPRHRLTSRCISSIFVVWWVAAWRWPRLGHYFRCRRQTMARQKSRAPYASVWL